MAVACLRTSSVVLLAAFWVFASFEHDLGFRVPYLNTFSFWTCSLKEPIYIKKLHCFLPGYFKVLIWSVDGSPKSESPENPKP